MGTEDKGRSVYKLKYPCLETLIEMWGEKEAIRCVFNFIMENYIWLAERGLETDIPDKIVVNGREYGKEFLR
jgi:hypothetical protein